MTSAASPSTSHDVVTDFLDRLGVADADGIATLFADQIDWWVGGDPRLPWVGPRTRRDQVAPYFHELWAALIPDQSQVELGCVISNGDEHVILGHFSHVARATKRRFDTDVALHLTVLNGQITRLHLYEDTLAVSHAWDHPLPPSSH